MNFFKQKVSPVIAALRSKLWVKILSFVLIPVYAVLGLMTVEYLNYRHLGSVIYLWKSSGKFIFSLTVIFAITLLFLLLCKKLWIFALCYGGFMVIVGCINCIKLAVNGDYFFPWDIYMAGNMGQLISFAKFDLPIFFWLFLFLIILFILFFKIADTDIYIKWYFRIPVAIAIIVYPIFLYNSPNTVSGYIEKAGMSFNDSILQESNYNANGFVNAFTINCFALKVEAPEDYSEQKVAQYLDGYSKTDAEQKPDVIVILSEAFTDIRELKGSEFSQNPLKNFDEISSRENAATGKLYTTALGGGTVRTEFEMLTGLTVDYLMNGTSPYLYLTKDTESYVSNYKNQGYNTFALHTYLGKFYMRNVAYPYIGFDEFISQDEVYENYEVTTRRGYITDDTFMNVLIDKLEQNPDKPNFIFGITMENHQAYKKSEPSDIIVDVKNEKLSQDVLDSVVTYTQGVYYADLSLKKLVDYIDSREKPTVLLFFGDHLPTLGGYNGAYRMAGNVTESGNYTQEDYDFLYSTPYLVYSNYGADLSVFEDGKISTYYMLSLLADCTKTQKTPYMNYLSDNFKNLSKYNVRLQIPLDDKQKEFINSMRLITYDRIK